jgi:hypothetical protein
VVCLFLREGVLAQESCNKATMHTVGVGCLVGVMSRVRSVIRLSWEARLGLRGCDTTCFF